MDKKTIIGLVLMVAVFVGFSFYQSYEMEKQQEYLDAKAKKEQEAKAKAKAAKKAEKTK